MRDNWLIGEPCLRPLVFKKKNPLEFVNCLTDEPSRKWNLNILNATIHDEIVQHILKLPFSHITEADSLFWRYSKDGKYSVKLGYRCAYDNNLNVGGSASPSVRSSIF